MTSAFFASCSRTSGAITVGCPAGLGTETAFIAAASILTLGLFLQSTATAIPLLATIAAIGLASRVRLPRPSRRISNFPTGPKHKGAKPSFDDLIGQHATVLSFDVVTRKGHVSYRGIVWAAESGDALAPQDTVRIDGRRGAKLFVQKIHSVTHD